MWTICGVCKKYSECEYYVHPSSSFSEAVKVYLRRLYTIFLPKQSWLSKMIYRSSVILSWTHLVRPWKWRYKLISVNTHAGGAKHYLTAAFTTSKFGRCFWVALGKWASRQLSNICCILQYNVFVCIPFLSVSVFREWMARTEKYEVCFNAQWSEIWYL